MVGFKLGLYRPPTSLPLVQLRRRAPLALGRASMFGGVNLLSSSTRFAGPHARVPMVGAARRRLRYGIVKPPLALGERRVGHRPPQGSVPSRSATRRFRLSVLSGEPPTEEPSTEKGNMLGVESLDRHLTQFSSHIKLPGLLYVESTVGRRSGSRPPHPGGRRPRYAPDTHRIVHSETRQPTA